MLNKKRNPRSGPPRLITVDLRTTQNRRRIGVGAFCGLALVVLLFVLNYGVAHLRFLTLEMRTETYRASALQMENMRKIRELEQSRDVKLDSETVRSIATTQLGMQQVSPKNRLDNFKPSPAAIAYANYSNYHSTSVKPYKNIVEDIANQVEISPIRKVLFSFIDAGKAFAAVTEINNERRIIDEKIVRTPTPAPTSDVHSENLSNDSVETTPAP
ncbi:MAG: hypothetical protein PHX74_12545 [Candidatus Sumerlaeales bacterium]|nr:hypothetical protein [Candidatus Sumerlaeales bacterium]